MKGILINILYKNLTECLDFNYVDNVGQMFVKKEITNVKNLMAEIKFLLLLTGKKSEMKCLCTFC